MIKKYPEPWLRKGTKTFYFWLTDAGGGRKMVSTGKRKGQKEQARDYIRDYIDRAEGGIASTFEEYSRPFFIWETCPRVARRLNEGKSIGRTHVEKSRRWLEMYILSDPVFPKLPLNKIKRGDILDLRERIKKKSPGENTTNKAIECVKTILSEAAFRQDINFNPGAEIGKVNYQQRERARLEVSEVRDLLSITADPMTWEVARIQNEVVFDRKKKPKNYNYREEFKRRVVEDLGISVSAADDLLKHLLADLVLSFFICTGVRAGELRAIRWGAVDLDTGRVKIDRAFKSEKEEGLPKWGKTREIALPRLMIDRLKQWYNLTPFNSDDDYTFAKADGTPPGQAWIRKNMKRTIEAAAERDDLDFEIGDRWVTPHALRHTLNTHLLAAGVPPLLVQTVLGWSSEEEKILTRVQRGYTELRLFNIEQVASKIDELYGPKPEKSAKKTSAGGAV